jgi:hypothetical protein
MVVPKTDALPLGYTPTIKKDFPPKQKILFLKTNKIRSLNRFVVLKK